MGEVAEQVALECVSFLLSVDAQWRPVWVHTPPCKVRQYFSDAKKYFHTVSHYISLHTVSDHIRADINISTT